MNQSAECCCTTLDREPNTQRPDPMVDESLQYGGPGAGGKFTTTAQARWQSSDDKGIRHSTFGWIELSNKLRDKELRRESVFPGYSFRRNRITISLNRIISLAKISSSLSTALQVLTLALPSSHSAQSRGRKSKFSKYYHSIRDHNNFSDPRVNFSS